MGKSDQLLSLNMILMAASTSPSVASSAWSATISSLIPKSLSCWSCVAHTLYRALTEGPLEVGETVLVAGEVVTCVELVASALVEGSPIDV